MLSIHPYSFYRHCSNTHIVQFEHYVRGFTQYEHCVQLFWINLGNKCYIERIINIAWVVVLTHLSLLNYLIKNIAHDEQFVHGCILDLHFIR